MAGTVVEVAAGIAVVEAAGRKSWKVAVHLARTAVEIEVMWCPARDTPSGCSLVRLASRSLVRRLEC